MNHQPFLSPNTSAASQQEAPLRQRDRATLLIMSYDSSRTLVYADRLESRTYRMALFA